MIYKNAKVYNDGSHYVAIPYEPAHRKSIAVVKDEKVSVGFEAFEEREDGIWPPSVVYDEITEDDEFGAFFDDIDDVWGEDSEEPCEAEEPSENVEKKFTRKEIFNELYKDCGMMPIKKCMRYLLDNLLPFFPSEKEAKEFVEVQMERKKRNSMLRRQRMARKVYLQEDFSYFCTFTYDDKKHSEESFKKKLKRCLWNYAYRYGWKYAGIWERGKDTNRLHFHGLFYILEGTLPGEWEITTDYNKKGHRLRTIIGNSFFNERFGRSEFEKITSKATICDALRYMTKYILKTGDRIVYSKNLPQFLITDIHGEDVICDCGVEGRKKLLFDDFKCYNDGEYVGKISKETKAKLRTEN